MLYLTRKPGESILINHNVKLTVIDIKGKSVRLGFLFSPEVRVLREEIFLRIQQEDQQAAEAGKYIQELEDLEVAKRMKKVQQATEATEAKEVKEREEEEPIQKKSNSSV